MCDYLKNLITILQYLIVLSAKLWFKKSWVIKLKQCAMHLTLKIFGNWLVIKLCATAIFDPLSVIIAANFLILIELITFNISFAKKFPIWFFR